MDRNHIFFGTLTANREGGRRGSQLVCSADRPRGQHSPSADDEAQSVQVAVVGGPEGRGHAILIWRVQVLLGGLLQQVQVAVPGGAVVLVIHGAEGCPGQHMGARGARSMGTALGRGELPGGPRWARTAPCSRQDT